MNSPKMSFIFTEFGSIVAITGDQDLNTWMRSSLTGLYRRSDRKASIFTMVKTKKN